MTASMMNTTPDVTSPNLHILAGCRTFSVEWVNFKVRKNIEYEPEEHELQLLRVIKGSYI